MVRIKLDENLSHEWKALLEEAGHDVASVREQFLQGVSDENLAVVCLTEERCLISSDADFAQATRFPPGRYPGLVVLRNPSQTLATDQKLLGQVVDFLRKKSPTGRLWIVEPGRIRVYDPNEP